MRLGIRVDVRGLKPGQGHDDPSDPADVERHARRFIAPRLQVPIEGPPGEIWQEIRAYLVDLDDPEGFDGGELIGSLLMYDDERRRDTPRG